MNESEINAEHRAAWHEAATQYGSVYEVPEDVSFEISERWRARHCMLANPDDHPTKVMRDYNIATNVAKEFVCEGWVAPVKRQDKMKQFFDWCNEHVGEQITAQQLADIHDFSPATAAARIRDNIGIFAKLKKGLYEIRDPKAERQRELAA
jgi:hypothetical protein